MEPIDATGRERVDEALQQWRQGDCVVGDHWFVFRNSLAKPLTEDGAVAASEDSARDIHGVPSRGRGAGGRSGAHAT